MANVTGEELKGAIRRNVDPSARMMTDACRGYAGLANEYAAHEIVSHADGEYVRGDAHTNTAENYFSILKRGINGVYHHVSEAHLPRYLSEFDFRYNNRTGHGISDSERTLRALRGAQGKRLLYREATNGPAAVNAERNGASAMSRFHSRKQFELRWRFGREPRRVSRQPGTKVKKKPRRKG